MTRRYLAYKSADGYLISQEFNGDRTEAQTFQLGCAQKLSLNWQDVVGIFDGADDTPEGFRDALKRTEDGYGYENVPPERMDTPPAGYEIWLFAGGKLSPMTGPYGVPLDSKV